MAAVAAARSIFRSASCRNAAAKVASGGGRAAARPASLRRSSRFPRIIVRRSTVEVSSFCVESLLPMHSATASALMTSLLSISRRGHGWLLEGDKILLNHWGRTHGWSLGLLNLCLAKGPNRRGCLDWRSTRHWAAVEQIPTQPCAGRQGDETH